MIINIVVFSSPMWLLATTDMVNNQEFVAGAIFLVVAKTIRATSFTPPCMGLNTTLIHVFKSKYYSHNPSSFRITGLKTHL